MDSVTIKEKPIIFSAESISAVLSGRKSQTRRVVKPQPVQTPDDAKNGYADGYSWGEGKKFVWSKYESLLTDAMARRCPYGAVGDRLWVKEAYFYATGSVDDGPDLIHYKADASPELLEVAESHKLWNSPLFMPRVASRITLELTEVRVERLQSMTEGDAVAEGYMYAGHGDDWLRADSYRTAWQKLNEKRGFPWESNPWVWKLSFSVVDQ